MRETRICRLIQFLLISFVFLSGRLSIHFLLSATNCNINPLISPSPNSERYFEGWIPIIVITLNRDGRSMREFREYFQDYGTIELIDATTPETLNDRVQFSKPYKAANKSIVLSCMHSHFRAISQA